MAWLLLAASVALGGLFTSPDGVLAEARAARDEDGAPRLIGIPGSADRADFEAQQHGKDAETLPLAVAPEPDDMRRALLLAGVSCGFHVEAYGRRGFKTTPMCAEPVTAMIVFPDGQRLSGIAHPGEEPGTLRLQLSAGAPLTVPLDSIKALQAPR